MSQNDSNHQANIQIVAIGASAGGLEAIQEFFDKMTSTSDLSFVVIQHLSPDFKSLMDQLLQSNTKMKVVISEDGMKIENNTIYLIPSKSNMTIVDGHLRITEQLRGHFLNLPIDIFFESLAKEYPGRAIGVVLSGTGSDGSKGLIELSRANCLTIAQQPDDAKFDGMPRNAINTKHVDLVLDVGEMPAAILAYNRNPDAFFESYEKNPPMNRSAYDQIFSMIYSHFNLDFSVYKPTTIARRINRRIIMLGLSSLMDYVKYALQNPDEVEVLYHELLIGVTQFFRDDKAFAILSNEVIPRLVASATEKRTGIRVWVSACSTGEEAYSIAMLMYDYMRENNLTIEVKIFATDVNKSYLDIAGRAIYPQQSLLCLPDGFKEKYFIACQNDLYQILPEIRNMIVFAPHNLITDPPFTKTDLVCCRNFLIYIQPAMQRRVIAALRFSTRLNGFMFLGPSETIGDKKGDLTVVNQTWKIFKKTMDIRQPLTLINPKISKVLLNKESLQPAANVARHASQIPTHAYDLLLEHIIKNGVLIDAQQKVLHIFGDSQSYLSLHQGRLDKDIIMMIKECFRTPLSVALHKVKTEKRPLICKHVSDGGSLYTIEVIPLLISEANAEVAYYFVVVKPEIVEEPEVNLIKFDVAEHSHQVVQELELELQHTRESLQTTIEEVETANEELQSANEELLASNEELQSTNEELHSVNEELYTVNTEHQKKIEELTKLNTDIDNLLRSNNVGTIFVDISQRIRLYTPEAAQIFQFMEHDIGRPLDSFTHTLDCDNLIENIKHVISSCNIYSKEVTSQDGSHYLMRILPYYAANNICDGAILCFIDIGDVKKANERFHLAVQPSPLGVIAVNEQGSIIFCNQPFEKLSGYSGGEVGTLNIADLLNDDFKDKHKDLVSQYFKNPSARIMASDLKIKLKTKHNKTLPVEINLAPVFDHDGNQFVIAHIMDVTLIKKAEYMLKDNNKKLEKLVLDRTKALSASESRYMELYENAPDMYASLDPLNHTIITCNNTLLKNIGIDDKAELIGKDVFQLYHPGCHEKAKIAFRSFTETGCVDNVELDLMRCDGSKLPVMLKVRAMRDESGNIVCSISSWRDISDKKALETATKQYRESESLFKENEILYKTILNSVTDGWWDWNLETDDEYLSPSFKDLFGYKDNEMANHADSWRKII